MLNKTKRPNPPFVIAVNYFFAIAFVMFFSAALTNTVLSQTITFQKTIVKTVNFYTKTQKMVLVK
jgi:hypothetical protein